MLGVILVQLFGVLLAVPFICSRPQFLSFKNSVIGLFPEPDVAAEILFVLNRQGFDFMFLMFGSALVFAGAIFAPRKVLEGALK